MYPPLVNKMNKLSDASPAGIISSIWSTIMWTVTLGGTLAQTGYEQLDFGCGEAVKSDDRLLASLELDPN